MAPKRARQQNKSVTIYNSKTGGTATVKKEKKGGSTGNNNTYEQSRNSLENWEFHYKAGELEDVKSTIKCKDLTGVPLIIGASVLNQKEILESLLKHGYNINEADKNNMTPLCWAIKLKQLEIVHTLLANKADPSIKPNSGDDIIFMALGSSGWNEESFIMLWNDLKNVGHIEVNSINKNGLSMLHLAVRREWNILVDILISNDANINVTNPNGVTPLMLASYRNDYGIATRLISKGASVKRKNSEGFTALCYAFSSAITKNLSPPFLLIERLQSELIKNKIYLSDYLKDRLRIVMSPSKRSNPDQPNVEQMLQHIFTFVLSHLDDGFNILWNELEVTHVIKEALEKHIGNKELIKLPLVTLLYIIKQLPGSVKSFGNELIVEDDLVRTGCLDMCISVCKRYTDENGIVYLAHSSIILARLTQMNSLKWIDTHHDDLLKYNDLYLSILETIELSLNDFKTLQEKADYFKSRLLLCTTTTTDDAESAVTNSEKSSETTPKTCTKKSKRRTKAMKAKIAKIKTAELTERFNVRKASEKKPVCEEPVKEAAARPECDENSCVNAIKSAITLLDDKTSRQNEGIRMPNRSIYTDDWKATIHNLPFKNRLELKTKDSDYVDVDLTIEYLDNLLGLIVNKYKVMWELESPFETDSGNDVDITIPIMEIEYQHNVERNTLTILHREFYNLVDGVKEFYDTDPDRYQRVLKNLEKLLLNHSIRGETLLEQITAMEVVRISATTPLNFEQELPKYIENVLDNKVIENCDIHIDILEHVSAPKSVDSNGMGDYVYLNDIAGLLGKRCVYSEKPVSTRSDYYHLTNSILNMCEENDDVVGSLCCNKGCDKEDTYKDSQDSRWCSLLRSLEMMEDSQTFVAGKIRISNPEKRKNHELSPSGNFGALEIGLGLDNIPLAVRFVPKSDRCAPLLNSHIDATIELKHRNILRYYLCAYDVNFLVIATPLCEYNLGEYVHKIKQTQMKICTVDIIRQILTGLMYLHDCDEPVVHGSLKPSNVLVDVYGNLKLAEFGIHKALAFFKKLPESTIIWFASESYKQYKQNRSVECTCASDIQVAGMLVHFAANFGGHAFGNDVVEILKNLEKATPQIYSKDMELYDLLTWMLLGEPSDRPTIHQVLSHIYFWSNPKKWTYVLACAGLSPKPNISLDIEKLHASLDKIALKENIVGNCWILTAKKLYPQTTFIDCEDTPSGLLRFIKYVKDNKIEMSEESREPISSFILNAFPHFVLSLYRMIENTEWSDHRMFMPFHNVVNY